MVKEVGMNKMESKENVYTEILNKADEIEKELIDFRRDFHAHPETGWLEMRTSAIIAEKLSDMGYEVQTGKKVCKEGMRMGVPDKNQIEAHLHVIKENRSERKEFHITAEMEKGYTGVIGVLNCGEGPEIVFRFDIDALPMQEDKKQSHTPYKKGFGSEYDGMMHACGHDCHTAIGLGTAKILSWMKEKLHGTVKLIFQPAEEGTRGAYGIVEAGHLEHTDYFVSGHVSSAYDDEEADLIPGSFGALATTKYTMIFSGQSAHAGRVPEEGKNAVLAAAHAAVGLSGISRHSEGMSRVNVGSIHGGTGRNIVADKAVLTMEVRGETTKINEYMSRRACEICKGAAAMEGCSCQIVKEGYAPSQTSDEELVNRIAELVKREYSKYKVSETLQVKNLDSEDVGFMMNQVQKHGGKATYMRLITKMESPQHTTAFDVDEAVLKKGVVVFSAIAADILS